MSHPPGLCVRHLDNGGLRVQAFVKVNGVEYCEPCSKAPDVVAAPPTAEDKPSADKTLEGRGGLCDEGKARLVKAVKAVKAAQEGAPEA